MSTKKAVSRIQSDRTKEVNQEFDRAGQGYGILYTSSILKGFKRAQPIWPLKQ
jgi:hypothetical protein